MFRSIQKILSNLFIRIHNLRRGGEHKCHGRETAARELVIFMVLSNHICDGKQDLASKMSDICTAAPIIKWETNTVFTELLRMVAFLFLHTISCYLSVEEMPEGFDTVRHLIWNP